LLRRENCSNKHQRKNNLRDITQFHTASLWFSQAAETLVGAGLGVMTARRARHFKIKTMIP